LTNYKTLLKEIKEPYKHKVIPCSQNRRFKIAMYPKIDLLLSIRIPSGFFAKIRQANPKILMEDQGTQTNQNNLKQEE
jgi:hypothetical protein